MKVFISWSGERSQALAMALHEWSQLILHYVKPWISKSDIDAGDRWASEVARELEATNFGIICITRENVNSAWILFEAGALAKSMKEGKMIPLLLDIDFKDITGPLAQFQAKRVDKAGVGEIMHSINRSASEPIADAKLNQLFEIMWPQLEQKVQAIPKHASAVRQNRPQQEILEELVSSIRGLDVRFRDLDGPARSRRRRFHFHPMMIEEITHRLELRRGDPLRMLLLASFLRDDVPWFYELALDAYRAGAAGSPRAKRARHRFLAGFQILRRGPFMEEFFAGDKSAFMMMREMEHFLIETGNGDDEPSESEENTDTDDAGSPAT